MGGTIKLPVNRKRIFLLMKENHLLIPKNHLYKSVSKGEDAETQNCYSQSVLGHRYDESDDSSFGWVYLHVVIDWGTLLSAHMSLTSKSSDWTAALNEAVNLQFPNGIREAIVIPEVVSDHGCQPTSTAFFKACFELGYMMPYEYERWFQASAA